MVAAEAVEAGVAAEVAVPLRLLDGLGLGLRLGLGLGQGVGSGCVPAVARQSKSVERSGAP